MLFRSECKAKHTYLMTDKIMVMHCDNLAKLHNVTIIFQRKYKYLFIAQQSFKLPVFESSSISKTLQNNKDQVW